MATLQQLETALKNADAAGDMDAARKLAAVVGAERQRRAADPSIAAQEQIPGNGPEDVLGTVPPPAQPTAGDVAKGVGEAAAATVTGATTGTLGYLKGAIEGVAKQIADGTLGDPQAAQEALQKAMSEAAKYTYQPKTEQGQQMAQGVAEAAAPLMGMAPELQQLSGAIKPAAGFAADTGAKAAQDVAQGAKAAVAKVTAKVKPSDKSVGAAETGMPAVRQSLASELPVPVDLTKGQKTGSFEQQRFERETAKLAEQGAPLRQHFNDQNQRIQQNIDAFIDQTGAQAQGNRSVGEMVDSTLVARQKKDRAKVRTLYKAAQNSKESEAVVNPSVPVTIGKGSDLEMTSTPTDYLNSRPSGVKTSRAVDDARKTGVNLGVLVKNEDGTYSAAPGVTVGKMSDWRREISQSLPAMPSDTEVRDVTVLKKLIDGVVDPVAGPLYRRARAARAKVARDYEDSFLAKNLLGKKPGSADRRVALEDVVRKVALDPGTSLDQMRHVRRLLQTKTGGKEGKGAQAWREVQGAVLQHIQEQATKNVARDENGNPIVSASALDKVITQLDKSGKLDYLFGKRGANQLRTINDVAKYVLVAPPGAVNTSNTASVLAGLMDVALTGMSGVPAPVATASRALISRIKDQKLKARIKDALGEK